MLKIYRIERVEGKDDKRTFVKDFEEKPAPDVTIGGRLLALKNETGFDHIAEPADDSAA